MPAGGDTGAPRNLQKRLALLQPEAGLVGKTFLDCGCGAGDYVAALRGAGVEAYGVEFLPDKVELARSRGLGDWVQCGNIEHLGWADASLDAALLNEVLEHVTDEVRALREVHRVLKPGGVLVIFSPNRLYPFETHGVDLKRGGRPVPHWFPFIPYVPLPIGRKIFTYRARNYWPSELAGIVRHVGFEIVHRGSIWQTFENISGSQPKVLATIGPLLRRLVTLFERVPLVRRLGVSQVVIARKSGTSQGHPTPAG